MPRRLWNALRLVLTLQARNWFPQIYLGMAVATIAGFRLALPQELVLLWLPPYLLGEQGVLACTLVAAHVYLERIEGSSTALAVTPLQSSEYVLALVIGASVWACVSGVLIWVAVVGFDARALWAALPLFLMSIVSGLIGLTFAVHLREFTSFLLGGAMPATTIIALPMLAYFGVVPEWSFVWLPSDWALAAFAQLSRAEPNIGHALNATAVLLVFCGVGFAVVNDRYRDWVRHALEPVRE